MLPEGGILCGKWKIPINTYYFIFHIQIYASLVFLFVDLFGFLVKSRAKKWTKLLPYSLSGCENPYKMESLSFFFPLLDYCDS